MLKDDPNQASGKPTGTSSDQPGEALGPTPLTQRHESPHHVMFERPTKPHLKKIQDGIPESTTFMESQLVPTPQGETKTPECLFIQEEPSGTLLDRSVKTKAEHSGTQNVLPTFEPIEPSGTWNRTLHLLEPSRNRGRTFSHIEPSGTSNRTFHSMEPSMAQNIPHVTEASRTLTMGYLRTPDSDFIMNIKTHNTHMNSGPITTQGMGSSHSLDGDFIATEDLPALVDILLLDSSEGGTNLKTQTPHDRCTSPQHNREETSNNKSRATKRKHEKITNPDESTTSAPKLEKVTKAKPGRRSGSIHVKLPRRTGDALDDVTDHSVNNASQQKKVTKKKVDKAPKTKSKSNNHQQTSTFTHQSSPITYQPSPDLHSVNIPTVDTPSTTLVAATNLLPNPVSLSSDSASKVNLDQTQKPSTHSIETQTSDDLPHPSIPDLSATKPQVINNVIPTPYPNETSNSQDQSIVKKVGESLVQAFIKELHSKSVSSTSYPEPMNQSTCGLGPLPNSSVFGAPSRQPHDQSHFSQDYAYDQANEHICLGYSDTRNCPTRSQQVSYEPTQPQHHPTRVFHRLTRPQDNPAPMPLSRSLNGQHRAPTPLRNQPIHPNPQNSPYKNGACFIPWKGKILEPSYNQIRKFGDDLNLIMEQVGARNPTPKELHYKQIRIYFSSRVLTPTPRELLQAHGDLHLNDDVSE